MGKRRKRKIRLKKRRSSRRLGAPPGTLEAPEGAPDSRLRAFRYDEDRLEELEGEEALSAAEPSKVVWLDMVGLGSIGLLQRIADRFGLHPLAMEDVVHTHQRAKVEDYPGSLFVVTRAVREQDDALDVEQITMFVGDGFVITFQEREGDAFEPVRERLRGSKGRIRTQGAAYLAYALLDATVDAMFPLLERYGARIEELEDEVWTAPSPELSERIYELKQELLSVRRSVLPLREAISRLVRGEHPQIDGDVRIYLRDCQDHLTQLVDLLETQRELIKGLMDAHLSSLGHRSNEVMKVLTMIATIFIPLSFIAGLYGMNFDPSASPWNMPELGWAFGYPAVLAVMIAIALSMVGFFRRKRWL